MTAVSTHPAAAAAAPEAAENLAPVPEPAGMLGTVRLGAPEADLGALRAYFMPHNDFGQMLLSNPRQVVGVFLGSLGEYVDLSAPLDAFFFEDDSHAASSIVMSLPLSDLEGAKQSAGFDVKSEGNGRFSVTPKPGAGREAGIIGKQGIPCAIFRGGAPVKGHLICAASREKLDIAGPYLARTVALQPARPGMRMEISEQALRSAMTKSQEKMHGPPGESIAEQQGRIVGQQLGLEWVEDIRDMAVDIQIGQGSVSAGLDFRFRSVKSPMSLAMLGSRAPVPQAFWKVPADADAAFFFPGAPAEAMRTAAASMWSRVAQIDLGLGHMPEGWRKAAGELRKVLLTGGPSIIAHGPAPDPQGALPSNPARQYRDARANARGWFLFATFEPVSAWTSNLRAARKAASFFPDHIPPIPKGAVGGPGSELRSLEEVHEIPVRPADGLPKGAMHLVHHVVPNPNFASRPSHPPLEGEYEQHIFVAGTEEMTWIVAAESEGLARARLKEALSGTSGGLGARSDLARLRSFTSGGIGFSTLKAFTAIAGDKDSTAELKMLDGALLSMRRLGAGGQTPVIFSFAPGGAGEGLAGTLRVSAEVAPAGAKDLLEWFQ